MAIYSLYASTEGHSQYSINIVTNSVRYLTNFLTSHGASTDAREISHLQIRAFILYLKDRPCFENHPFTPPQPRGLSGHTINTYLRSICGFFSWMKSEDIIDSSPFDKLKVPAPPKKVITPFSQTQIRDLLAVIDTSSSVGFRNYTMILVFLDSGIRLSELINLKLSNVSMEEGLIKVLGKGNRERIVPIGKQVQHQLWRYISRYRPEPEMPRCDLVFLTEDGRPITKDRLDMIMSKYGREAGLSGVRCSPHTLRHTAAVNFLRNGGDVFSLQRMLGHSSLEMTRHYCQISDVDVKKAHNTASPVDNLGLRPNNNRSHTRRYRQPR
ncbi:tyrosine-type recombinase/integrase [Chloroflexota bacterium]